GRFLIPKIHSTWSTQSILAMDFVQAKPIESCVHESQDKRDSIMTALFELLFKEIFQFQLVQTDPNFANYQYQPHTGKIVLLDFGATRVYQDSISEGYHQLIRGAIDGNSVQVEAAARQIGFFSEQILPEQKQAVLELFHQACEPIRSHRVYDFGTSELAAKIKDKGMTLSMELNYWHTPPADALFFHRKLGGLYLLAAKLKARVNVRAIFDQVGQTLPSSVSPL
ncbi:MAG: AarF/UbiB family protein, partial [Gammaproteobacteria bacterium]|nr:AarF/UbiB family protein [Gammaproteobacteria bacterium]